MFLETGTKQYHMLHGAHVLGSSDACIEQNITYTQMVHMVAKSPAHILKFLTTPVHVPTPPPLPSW